jgi:O-antigen/teichoic acid export membrane protein
MSVQRQAIKNVTAMWIGLLINAAVGFFLSPFILHRLGDEAFSVWILVFAVTGYFALLDFGIRSAIVKYTAKFTAQQDTEQLSRHLSTSLVFLMAIALFVLLTTAAGTHYLHLLFKVPAGLIRPARILFLISGISVACAFPLSVFAGVLEGLQKFSWLQLTQIGVTLLRGILIVLALTFGGGLLTIGIITVALTLLSYFIFLGMALRVLSVQIRWAHVDKSTLCEMAAYGVFAFVILAAEKLRFQSDAIVIGAFLSASAITLFSVGAKLVEYSSYAARSMSQIITPMSSEFHAAGDMDRLRRTFLAGNRACAFITFPLCVTLAILGKPIIAAWVGPRYLSCYFVLLVLILPRSLYLAQSASIRILLGMGHHRVLASVLLLEGAGNLLLSLLLVKPLGILGVALGTSIPLICTSVLFLPRHLCRVLDMPVRRFLSRAYFLPLILCVPMAAELWIVGSQLPIHGIGGLALEISVGGAVYGIGLALVLFTKRPPRLRPWQAFAQLLEPK